MSSFGYCFIRAFTPKTLAMTECFCWLGTRGGCPGTVSFTYGHALMYWMWATGCGRAFRCCSRSVFSGRMTGGRSGDIDMFSFMLAVFRCRAFISHLFRWDRSTKSRMMPASAFLLSRWHAEKCVSVASRMRSLSFASVTHFVRVVWSSSPSAPFSPWINSDHLRRWTSRSIVYDARLVVTVATCAASAGRLVLWTHRRPLSPAQTRSPALPILLQVSSIFFLVFSSIVLMTVKRFSNCLTTISWKALRILMSTGVAISSFCNFLCASSAHARCRLYAVGLMTFLHSCVHAATTHFPLFMCTICSDRTDYLLYTAAAGVIPRGRHSPG